MKVMKMGCISSKSDINDRHPNIFQVTNVDDQGKKIKPGKLQVTDKDLIFYQRGKKPTKWPLRALRKYGCDTDIFSFECGRRCPTGHGIYAFKCRKAEQLFNIVQQYITGNLSDDSNTTHNDFLANGQILGTRRPNSSNIFQSQTEGYLNPVSVPPISRPIVGNSMPGSVGSNGPLSPTLSSPPQSETPTEYNNNKRGSLVSEPTYTNSVVLDSSLMLPQSINMGSADIAGDVSSSSHVYMNIDMPQAVTDDPEERHCYANIDTEDLEAIRPPDTPLAPCVSVDSTTVEEVNYAELDLNGGGDGNAKVSPVTSDVPSIKEKYVTIDFQKTTALSQSINPNMTIEEGCRKTRHNSTINYHSSISD